MDEENEEEIVLVSEDVVDGVIVPVGDAFGTGDRVAEPDCDDVSVIDIDALEEGVELSLAVTLAEAVWPNAIRGIVADKTQTTRASNSRVDGRMRLNACATTKVF